MPHGKKLCFVGSMLGRHPGLIPNPAELLAAKFKQEGYSVITVSSSLNRFARLVDIITTLIRRRHEIDVLCLQVFGEASFLIEDMASWLGRLLDKRIVMVLHGGTLPDFMKRFPNWSCRIFRRAHAIVSPSAYLARMMEGYGFHGEVIPNMLDLDAYAFRKRSSVKPRLFWMRSFYPYYNPLMAVRVLAKLKQVLPEAALVMAGRDKGMLAETRNLAAQLGISESVRFPGFLDMAGKLRDMADADIYINTNQVDNMPIAVLEAGALGLPVVAANVGGIGDLLTHEETGLLVPDNDADAMTEAIVRLVRHPRLAEKLSLQGRRLAQRSSWEQVRPVWKRVFDGGIGSEMEGTDSAR